MCDFDEFIHTTKDGIIMEVEVQVTLRGKGQMVEYLIEEQLFWRTMNFYRQLSIPKVEEFRRRFKVEILDKGQITDEV